MWCTRLAENTERKNRQLHTIARLCRAVSSQLRHVSTIWKKNLLNGNISSTCPRNMVNIGALAAEIDREFGHHCKFQPISRLGFDRYCSDVAQRKSTKLCTTFAVSWAGTGTLAPWRNFAECKTHFASKVLRSPILAALMHGTPAAKLCGVVQGMELSQRAPPIFDWAAITLGVGPHF